MQPADITERLKELRNRMGMSLRDLAKAADMSPATLSAIENGLSSPTLATVHKLLKALGTDFGTFLSDDDPSEKGFMFPAGQMRTINDVHRQYRLMFPKREDLRFEMIMETLSPSEGEGEWEIHDCDVGGILLEGGPLRLEISGKGIYTLGLGDAFYIHARQKHRAVNTGTTTVKMMTVFDPPRY